MSAGEASHPSADAGGEADGRSEQQPVGAGPRCGGIALAASLAAMQIACSG